MAASKAFILLLFIGLALSSAKADSTSSAVATSPIQSLLGIGLLGGLVYLVLNLLSALPLPLVLILLLVLLPYLLNLLGIGDGDVGNFVAKVSKEISSLSAAAKQPHPHVSKKNRRQPHHTKSAEECEDC